MGFVLKIGWHTCQNILMEVFQKHIGSLFWLLIQFSDLLKPARTHCEDKNCLFFFYYLCIEIIF
jgi:hypothetical protein